MGVSPHCAAAAVPHPAHHGLHAGAARAGREANPAAGVLDSQTSRPRTRQGAVGTALRSGWRGQSGRQGMKTALLLDLVQEHPECFRRNVVHTGSMAGLGDLWSHPPR